MEFIEKKIKKRIQAIQILFKSEYIPLDTFSDLLNFNKKQTKNFINSLNDIIIELGKLKLDKNILCIKLKKEVNQKDIFYRIYKDSNILNFFEFLINNTESSSISKFMDSNFFSVAHAYRIKKKANIFLNSYGLKIENNTINGTEVKIRYFIAYLCFEYGVVYNPITKEDLLIAREFILATNESINKEFLEYSKEKYLFFELLLILSWKRKHKKIYFESFYEKKELKSIFIYKKIKELSNSFFKRKLNIEFFEEDYEYLFLIYCSTENCIFADQWQQDDIYLVHRIIFNDLLYIDLLNLLRKNLVYGEKIISTRAFKVSMIYFYKNFVSEIYMFIPDDIVVTIDLNNTSLKILENIVTNTFNEWMDRNCLSYSIPYQKKKNFIFQIYTIYLSIVSNPDIIIVTDSVSEFEILKRVIISTLNSDYEKVNLFLLATQNIKEQFKNISDSSIIVCNPKFNKLIRKEFSESSNIVAISLDQLSKNILDIQSAIFKQKEKNLLHILNEEYKVYLNDRTENSKSD